MSRSDIQAGKAYVSLYIKGGELTKGLKAAQKQLKDFGSQLLGVGAAFTGAGAAIGTSLFGALSHFANVGDALDEMSARTGINTSALAELSYAADLSGSSIDETERFIRRMQQSISDAANGADAAADALKQVGLTAADLKDLSPEDQFDKIAAGIAAIENPTERASASMHIFGKSGTQLLPMLENLKEMRQEARDLGLAPSPESIAASAEVADSFVRVRKSIGAVAYEIGASLAPMAIKLMKSMVGAIQVVRKWITENRGFIVAAAQVGAVLFIVGAAITTVGALILGASVAIGGLLAIFSAIGTVIGVISSPIVLIGLAIAGIAYAAIQAYGGFGKLFALIPKFTEMREIVVGTFKGIYDAIAAGDLALAGQIAFTGLKLIVMQAMQSISSLIGGIWSKTIGMLASLVLEGDFAGAWNTAVVVMQSVWESFSGAIVNGFTSACRSVIDVWKKTVDYITNYLLQEAGKGGVLGAFFESISGIDVKAEIERDARLKAALKAAGGNDGTGKDIFSDVKAGTYSDPATAATAASLNAKLDALKEQARVNKAAADQALNAAVGTGDQAVNEDIARLEGELKGLRERAKAKRAEANAAAIKLGPQDNAAFGGSGAGQSVTSSFSAAALVNIGQGTAANPTVKELQEMRREQRAERQKAREEHRETIREMQRQRNMGVGLF